MSKLLPTGSCGCSKLLPTSSQQQQQRQQRRRTTRWRSVQILAFFVCAVGALNYFFLSRKQHQHDEQLPQDWDAFLPTDILRRFVTDEQHELQESESSPTTKTIETEAPRDKSQRTLQTKSQEGHLFQHNHSNHHTNSDVNSNVDNKVGIWKLRGKAKSNKHTVPVSRPAKLDTDKKPTSTIAAAIATATTVNDNANANRRPSGNPVKATARNDAPSKALAEDDPNTIMNYGPSRIPGYLVLSNNQTMPRFGYVMRDLATRLMDRRIGSSNVLVVSPEAPKVMALLRKRYGTMPVSKDNAMTAEAEGNLRRETKHAVGGSMLIRAHREGHASYGLDAMTSLDDWWNSFARNRLARKPHRIRLALIDHDMLNNNILASAHQLLRESSISYIVVGFGAYPTKDSTAANYGKEAVGQLLALKYKVQVLSLSHTAAPGSLSLQDLMMRPNFDLTQKNYHQFFRAMSQRADQVGVPILGYVFCTKGLDLAIPTALEYTPAISKHGVTYKQCYDTKLKVEFVETQSATRLSFLKPYSKFSRTNNATSQQEPPQFPLVINCQGSRIYNTTKTNALKAIWHSGATIETSEAACVRTLCMGVEKVACNSRILPHNATEKQEGRYDDTRDMSTTTSTASEVSTARPNLLVIKVNPISRARFERSLVKTHALIQRLNFTSFGKFTAAHDGTDLDASLGGTESHASNATHEKRLQWLWDTLRHHGYATFKAKDRCVEVENAEKIDPLHPQFHHGGALQKMFCFEFRRPNCLGDTAAAQHLVDYAKRFMESYQRHNRPWAAMLEFVDSHEDTQTLEGTLDDPLWRFLYSVYQARSSCGTNSALCSVWDNTMIVVTSDTGMHYGSYFLSPQGQKEKAQPILYMHLPKTLSSVSVVVEDNAKMWTTPFDVFETLLETARTSLSSDDDAVGNSLLRPIPRSRDSCWTTEGIASKVCSDLLADDSTKPAMMPNPPSILSFYADIPRPHKRITPVCSVTQSKEIFKNKTKPCVCATDRRPWYNCSRHPWQDGLNVTTKESFAMVDCQEGRAFEIKVQQDPEILNRPELVQAKASPSYQDRPNILLLEVDSVSTAYADRHFPRTRELLNSLRLRRSNENTNGYACGANETYCAAEFDSFSVVGSNSIPNQIATFGGCIVTTAQENCPQIQVDHQNRSICVDAHHQAYNMELVNHHRSSATFCLVDKRKKSPWIFDIAKAAGYVSLFAEEFCYRKSIWVPQGNMFQLEADILPSEFFCRVAERRAAKQGRKIVGPAFRYGYNAPPGQPLCVDEHGGYASAQVGLDHIESMWDTYQEVPKFAYLNAIAAHYYQDFKSMTGRAEAYDLLLSSFLQRMLSRPDTRNTIIVLRADHGLQGGPQTPDYSMQVEAFRPWTEVIVPKNLPGLSLDNLFINQQRLATGFDLYNTLVSSIVGPDQLSTIPEMPRWSHHLWRSTIPSARTCADAKVRAEYCLLEDQRTFTAPNLGTCNLAEDVQSLVCPHQTGTFRVQMSLDVSAAFFTSESIQPKVCPTDGSSRVSLNPSLADTWKTMDQEQLDNPNPADTRVHPRQASIMSTLVAELAGAIDKAEARPLNVCMAGFGGGQAAALFLDSSPALDIHLFDTMDRPYQQPLLHSIERQYGKDRIVLRQGDPSLAFPIFLSPIVETTATNKKARCDFLFGTNNTFDLVKNAPCGILVASGARTSLQDRQVMFGTTTAEWSQLRKDGCVKDISCFTEDPSSLSLKNRVLSVSYKFCMGVTTGKCQPAFARNGMNKNKKSMAEQCESKMAQITHQIVLNQVCPLHEIAVPSPITPPKWSNKIKKKT